MSDGIDLQSARLLRRLWSKSLEKITQADVDFSVLGVGTTTPEASSLLDLESTSKGFLPPRMTLAQRNAIESPSTGLVIFNVTTNTLNLYNGSAWHELARKIRRTDLSSQNTGSNSSYTMPEAYLTGSLTAFWNGLRMLDSDITENNSTTFTISVTPASDDSLFITYQKA